MKVLVVERCGTELGVPGGRADGDWRILKAFRHTAKGRAAASRFIDRRNVGMEMEFSNFRIRTMEVG